MAEWFARHQLNGALIMRVKETNEIRELTTAELNEVSGGVIDPFIAGMLFGGAWSVAGVIVGATLTMPNLWDQVEAYANSQRG
jgi:hypothetical protein